MDGHLLWTFLRIGTLYGTVAVATFVFMGWYDPPELGDGGLLRAALLAVPLSAGIGYLWGSRKYRQEEALILDSIERPVLRDGQRVMVSGPIRPMGASLNSPFGRADCVAYQYQIEHEGRDPHHRNRFIWFRDYWGMALWPCQVETAAGPVRMLGYARLETPGLVLEDDAAYRAAEAYLRATTFRYPASAGERLASLAEPLDTESDTFQDDICTDAAYARSGAKQTPEELRKLRLTERRLDVGQTVCAAGVYSEEKKALVPTPRGGPQLRISTVSPQFWASESRDAATMYVRWGAGLTLFGLGCALSMRWW